LKAIFYSSATHLKRTELDPQNKIEGNKIGFTVKSDDGVVADSLCFASFIYCRCGSSQTVAFHPKERCKKKEMHAYASQETARKAEAASTASTLGGGNAPSATLFLRPPSSVTRDIL
jgi:hypothetical protein